LSAIATTHETFIARLAGELLESIPLGLRRVLSGPMNLIRIGEREATLSPRRLHGRPVMLEVAPSLVLRTRLTVPAAGRRDLPFAVELLVGAETPFAANEVLTDVRFVRSLPETGELAFEIRLIPRKKIISALAQFRFKPSQVSAIAVREDPRPFSVAGLAATRRLFLRPQLGWLAPLVISLGALTAWMYFESASWTETISWLEQEVDAELTNLRATLAALEERDAGAERERAVREAFASAPSAFSVLHAMRANLPVDTFVTRAQMQAGEFRFSVETPNALSDVKTLQAGLGEHDVRVEGSVVDMPNGLQATVFLLTSRVQP
jgi:hypothetical protein